MRCERCGRQLAPSKKGDSRFFCLKADCNLKNLKPQTPTRTYHIVTWLGKKLERLLFHIPAGVNPSLFFPRSVLSSSSVLVSPGLVYCPEIIANLRLSSLFHFSTSSPFFFHASFSFPLFQTNPAGLCIFFSPKQAQRRSPFFSSFRINSPLRCRRQVLDFRSSFFSSHP